MNKKRDCYVGKGRKELKPFVLSDNSQEKCNVEHSNGFIEANSSIPEQICKYCYIPMKYLFREKLFDIFRCETCDYIKRINLYQKLPKDKQTKQIEQGKTI